MASDRWDVRQAVVIEGLARFRDQFKTQTIYVDYQTQQPLYLVRRGDRGRILDVGIAVHRFSGDVAGYPEFERGRQGERLRPGRRGLLRAWPTTAAGTANPGT